MNARTRTAFSLLFILFAAFSAVAQSAGPLEVTIEPLKRADDGSVATALVTLRNKTGVDLTNIDVDVVLNSYGKQVTLTATDAPAFAPQWSCAQTGAQSFRCRLPFFRTGGNPDAGSWPVWPLLVTVSPAQEGRFVLNATATWKQGDATLVSGPAGSGGVYEREVRITNTNDAGEGSLRGAIEYANATCTRDAVPCALRFRFEEPLPEQGWYTIRPLTPLPAIVASDMSLVRANDEPIVEIDGSLLAIGHGLQARAQGPLFIDGLYIGGFPWDGIAITRREWTEISRLVAGVRPDGSPNPNGSRGVTIDPPASNITLVNSLMSGNHRSGVFIWGGENISMQWCTLVENGASGLAVGPLARDVRMVSSRIERNAHMGIAVVRGARGLSVENTWNTGNRGLAIDHGLDEFSGYVRPPADAALPAPRIESATFDEQTNQLRIRGTFDAPDPNRQWKLTVFSESFAALWPERTLPQTTFTGTSFEILVSAHDPSTFAATVSSAEPSEWSTSEFSEPFFFAGAGNKLQSTVLRSR